MKRYIALLLTALVALVSCQREELDPVGKVPAGQPVDLVLNFGAKDALSMEIGTKATLDVAAETKVYNMYVFIFGSDGKKIYNHYFDYTNRNESSRPDWWTVTNRDDSADGELHIHTVSQTNCRMYGISNIDADMVNISPELLATVQTEDELKAMVSTLNQNIVSRNGYFPMSGSLDIPDTGNLATLNGRLALKRLDAKVTFKVSVAAGSKIESFTPLKWQVFNVPCDSYIVPNTVDSDKAYFNTAKMNYETKDGNIHGFSFYMQENRKAATGNFTDYKERDRKNGNTFVNADAHSTYVVFSGKLEYKDPTKLDNSGTEGAVLNAEVTYTVHLGNFSSDVKDFRTQRNNAYVYNVKIMDVNDIRVEVETAESTNTENEPGAEGIVTIAKEEIFSCDAHYASHVMTFHAANIDPESISWYVKTPFTPDGGSPKVVNGIDITTGLDYEWVEFRLNDRNPQNDSYFNEKRQLYQPRNPEGYAASVPYKDRTMNVSELCQYLKEQAQRMEAGLENDFDSGNDNDPLPKICVTAFVNEYYYEKNPLTGAEDPLLWKKFVNQDERRMNILADTKSSVDGKSTIIGAAFTVIQQSIQSIYNENAPDLQTAWGTEHADDEKYENSGWDYLYEPAAGYYFNDYGTNRGNTDLYNGRLNSMKEWTLATPSGAWANKSLRWDLFLKLDAENTVPYLNTQFAGLRYSCMSRNRDNNGNGVIDPEEVRWYMGATRQLIGIFMGEYGLDNDAVLYQRPAETYAMDGLKWRQHVLSSTQYNNNNSDNPTEIWAEEGIATGAYRVSFQGTALTTRCLRNLGMEDQNTTAATDPGLNQTLRDIPQDYVVVDGGSGDGTGYTFDLSRLNERSLRYFTSRELDVADQNSLQNCLYRRFQCEPLNPSTTKSFSQIEIDVLNDNISAALGQNDYCPEGYRLPNQRELSIMLNYIPTLTYWSGTPRSRSYPTRTTYSFGPRGTYKDYQKEPQKHFFGANNPGGLVPNIYMVTKGQDGMTASRCVRDFDGETNGDIVQKMNFQFGDLTGSAVYYKNSAFSVSATASNRVTVNEVRINGQTVAHSTNAGAATETISASTNTLKLTALGSVPVEVQYDVVYAGRAYTLTHVYNVDVAFPYENADYYTISSFGNRDMYVYKTSGDNRITVVQNAQEPSVATLGEQDAKRYFWKLVKSGAGYKIQSLSYGYASGTPETQLTTVAEANAPVYTIEFNANGAIGLKTGNVYWNRRAGGNNIGTYGQFDANSQFYMIPHWN